MASTTDTKASAVAFKDKGNAAFKAQNWLEAIDCYTRAIDLKNDEPPFYTNRAQVGLPTRDEFCPHTDITFQAHIKLENYGLAIADATKAIELDPNFVKVRRCPPAASSETEQGHL